MDLTDSSTKTGFSFCKAHSNLTVRFGQDGNCCMPLSVLVIVFMHNHHPLSPDVRQIAEWSWKSGFETGKNSRWKEARYLHHCSKKTHSSTMNISFGLYMGEKEISRVLSPQKFIAASTSGIAFYQDTMEALYFQEEIHPLEYPQHKEEEASIFWSEILQTIHYTQIPSSATLLSLRFSFSFMVSSFPQLYTPI